MHEGKADLYCDYGHLAIEAGDYVVLPRGTLWRIDCEAPVQDMLLIEGEQFPSYTLPDKGPWPSEHAIFDPAMLDLPRMDEAFRAQQKGAVAARDWRGVVKRRDQLSTVTYPLQPARRAGLARLAAPACASTCATSGR